MVRTYKRKVGARKYRNFSTEELSKACREILNKKISYREAAKKYNISMGCLAKHIKVFQMQKQINKHQASEMEDDSTSNRLQEDDSTETNSGPVCEEVPSSSDVTCTPSTSTSTGTGIRATSMPSTPVGFNDSPRGSITSIDSTPGTIPIYKPGHPTVFSALEEAIIVDYICLISEWGFPIDSLGLRKLAKSYLDSNGRCVPTFKDNTPGRDWSQNFLKRHQHILTQRMCQNIKYARATTNEEVLTNYFNNLHASEVQAIPPGNILNYDETNMVDDPKSKKMIFKRSLKRSERVMNFTKSATSVMFACSDDGQLLPPYVVYKAEGMWSTWTLGGPPGTRYNRTKSGWFDECCFLDWFNTIVVPWAKSRNGPKMIIGDNLSSHFSGEIIKKCNELTISFICLPPNTTHLTQPLDVGVYGPLKKEWRKALEAWKLGPGRKRPTLSKDEFPRILNTVLNNMKDRMSKNIKSGFSATGIRPFNKEQVMKRLPKTSLENKKDSEEDKARKEALVSSQIGTAVLGILQELRSKKTPERKNKRTKINVKPGKSVSLDEIEDNPDDPDADPNGAGVGPSSSEQSLKTSSKKTSKCNTKIKAKKRSLKKEIKKGSLVSTKEKKKICKTNKLKNLKRKRNKWEDSSNSTSDLSSVEYDGISSSEDEDMGLNELPANDEIQSLPAPEDCMPGHSKESCTKSTTGTTTPEREPTPGSWVVVKYASKRDIFHYFIGQVIYKYEKGLEIKFLRNQGNNKFIWPPQDDYDNVPYPDVVKVLPEPTMVSSRGSGVFTFNVDLSGYTII